MRENVFLLVDWLFGGFQFSPIPMVKSQDIFLLTWRLNRKGVTLRGQNLTVALFISWNFDWTNDHKWQECICINTFWKLGYSNFFQFVQFKNANNWASYEIIITWRIGYRFFQFRICLINSNNEYIRQHDWHYIA